MANASFTEVSQPDIFLKLTYAEASALKRLIGSGVIGGGRRWIISRIFEALDELGIDEGPNDLDGNHGPARFMSGCA